MSKEDNAAKVEGESKPAYVINQFNNDFTTDRINVVLIDKDGGSVSVYAKSGDDTSKNGIREGALKALRDAIEAIEKY